MTNPSADYGVHSEVGKLRKVLVCSPGLAHERLTPSNCDELLFDDVLWVQNARRDHFDFIDKMRERDVEVVELHECSERDDENHDAKAWLLDRKIVANEVGLGLVDDTRGFLDSLQPRRLAELLIGGMSTRDLPKEIQSGYRALAREGRRCHRVFDAATAEHPLYPRHHMLDLQAASRSIRCSGLRGTTRRC